MQLGVMLRLFLSSLEIRFLSLISINSRSLRSSYVQKTVLFFCHVQNSFVFKVSDVYMLGL